MNHITNHNKSQTRASSVNYMKIRRLSSNAKSSSIPFFSPCTDATDWVAQGDGWGTAELVLNHIVLQAILQDKLNLNTIEAIPSVTQSLNEPPTIYYTSIVEDKQQNACHEQNKTLSNLRLYQSHCPVKAQHWDSPPITDLRHQGAWQAKKFSFA